MLEKTHAAILALAIARVPSAWTERDLPALLRGHREEDDHVLFGIHIRAAGLTHTYRPGRRFGELFAPNARGKMLRFVRRAKATRDRERAARLLGRACHLLGDMAVPARTRGVWHLAGDPLEAWLEARHAELARLVPDTLAIADADAGAIADALASASSAHDADTTRTPWGRLAYARLRRGTRLGEGAIATQAEALLPLAVASTGALLRAVSPPG
jgi:hypothetical protein